MRLGEIAKAHLGFINISAFHFHTNVISSFFNRLWFVWRSLTITLSREGRRENCFRLWESIINNPINKAASPQSHDQYAGGAKCVRLHDSMECEKRASVSSQ